MKDIKKNKIFYKDISTDVICLSGFFQKKSRDIVFLFIPGAAHTSKYFIQSLNNKNGWATNLSRKGFDCYIFEYPKINIKNNLKIDNFIILNLLKVLIKGINKDIILVTHSLGALYGWKLAEISNKITKLIAISPSPPSNMIKRVKIINQKNNIFDIIFFGQSLTMNFSKPCKFSKSTILSDFIGESKQFPLEFLNEYEASLVSFPSLLLKERVILPPKRLFIRNFNNFKNKDLFIITGEFDLKHSKYEDYKVVDFFKKNKINKIQQIYLPDVKIRGNGHLLFAEKNNNKILNFILKKINLKNQKN